MANLRNGKMLLRLIGGVPAGNDDGIGANSHTIEYTENGKTTRILIDLGVKLPSDEMKKKHPEFTGIMPDFRCFFPKEDGTPAELPIDAITFTHGHADHLDGLIYMTLYANAHKLKMPPIVGSQYTKNTLYSLLKQHNLPKGQFPEFEIMQPCRGKKIDKTEMITMPVSHTTPGAYGYIFEKSDIGYFEQGDNRMLPSHLGVGGNNQLTIGMLRKLKVTHFTIDSTSSGNKHSKDISFERTLDEIGRFFDETKGKQAFSPVISRSIENLLPILIAGKEHGKKIFIDGFQLRHAFNNWKNDNTVYYMEEGKLHSTSDKKTLKELRNNGIKIYCADDFCEHVWNYDNIINANADNYAASVGNKDRLVIVSGAFAEASDMQRSGAIRIAEDAHMTFHADKDTAVLFAQRIIEGLNDQGVINMMNSFLRQGASIYLNYMSEPVLVKKNCHSILNNCKFVEAQLSGHSDEESTRRNADIIASNAKNFKDFQKSGLKLQGLAIHGNEEQRQNSIKALAEDNRIECHSFCNGDVVELAPGVSKLIGHTNVDDQKFLGIINEPFSGEYVCKSLNGVYDENLQGEDIVWPKLSPSSVRTNLKIERALEKAADLELEGSRSSMNKYVVQNGKNAGKLKKLPQSDEERRRKIEAKIAKNDKHKEDNKKRKLERNQKINGYGGFEM